MIQQLDKRTGAVLAEYPSLAEAARKVGGHPSALCNCIKDPTKSSKGFKWARVDDKIDEREGEEWRDFHGARVSSHARVQVRKGGAVRDATTLPRTGRYPTVNIDGTSWSLAHLVAHVFLGAPRAARLEYRDNDCDNATVDNIIVTKKRERPESTGGQPAARPVLQMSYDGAVTINRFPSINEAARRTKTDLSSLSKCANGKLPRAGLYVWKFAEEVEGDGADE